MMKLRHHLSHSSFVGYLPPRRPSRVLSSNNPAVYWFLFFSRSWVVVKSLRPFVLLLSGMRWIMWYVSLFNAFQLFVGYFIASSTIEGRSKSFVLLRGPRSVFRFLDALWVPFFLVRIPFWWMQWKMMYDIIYHFPSFLSVAYYLVDYRGFLSNFVASSS